MSYAGRITTGDAPSVTRKPALAKLALVIAFVVVIAAAAVLIAMGSGAGTQSNVASDGLRGNSPSPFPGLSNQAERAVPGRSSAEAGAIIHPRAIPPVVDTAPSRGSVAIKPRR
jgi:hypothetical protein